MDAKVDPFSIEERRAAKPRVVLEAINLSYSVQGTAVDDDEESGDGTGEGGESTSSDLFEEEELKETEEGEYGKFGVMNKCVSCLSTSCSVCRSPPMDLKLLDSATLKVEPGTMMALMGPSGAGKTTLMDVIAGRKTEGQITGQILFNGRERDAYFSRYTGYCEQQDLHMEYTTVWEAVRLSAFTRLPPSWSKEEKIANARHVIERLRLTNVANVLVKNLRSEQKKRLTVAVELVTNPSVLFLDEPTSGLDATEAAEIIRVVKEEAEKGMSVVCTIHQPSSQIFALFSSILLLKKGGKTVFAGPADTMTEYFHSQLGINIPPYENPADFALEIASIPDGPSDPAKKWAAFVRQRDAQKEIEAQMGGSIERRSSQKLSISDKARIAEYNTKYPAPFSAQCKEILNRSMKSFWRRPEDFQLKVLRNLAMGLLFGGTFYSLENDQAGLHSRVGYFFFLLIGSTYNCFAQISLIILDRPAFYRERLSGCYQALVYLLGLILPELPLQLLMFLLLVLPSYFMAGLRSGPEYFFYFLMCGYGASVLAFCLVNLIAIAAFNAPVATIVASVAISIAEMLAGFFIPRDEIPGWWIWGYYASFVRYPLEGLSINELADHEFNCGPNGTKGAVPVPVGDNIQYYCPITNGNQFLDALNMDTSHKWPYLGVTYGLLAVFVLLCWMALVKIVHIKR